MSKEKQIEEMTKDMCDCCRATVVEEEYPCQNSVCEGVRKHAEALYNAGYRKQSENTVELPCKVGDTVWFNTFKKNATVCVGVQPHTIDRIDISFVCDTKNLIETHVHDWEIGKTVFLTKEKAEQAFAKMKGSTE